MNRRFARVVKKTKALCHTTLQLFKKVWDNLIFPATMVALLFGAGTYINKVATYNTEARIYKELLESSRSGGTVAIRNAKGGVAIIRVRKAW